MQVQWLGDPGAEAVPLRGAGGGGLRASAFVLLEFKPAAVERHPRESKASLKRSRSLSASKEKLSDG